MNTSTKTYGWKAEDLTSVREVFDPHPKESGKDPGRNEKNEAFPRVMRIILDLYPRSKTPRLPVTPGMTFLPLAWRMDDPYERETYTRLS